MDINPLEIDILGIAGLPGFCLYNNYSISTNM